MGLDEGHRLFLSQVPDNDEDRLIGEVLSAVKLLEVGYRDPVQGFFRPMGRPAVGMAMKDQLMEGLHRHVAGIVVIAHDLAEDLRADPLHFLFGKGGMLQHIGQEREAEIRILFEYAS